MFDFIFKAARNDSNVHRQPSVWVHKIKAPKFRDFFIIQRPKIGETFIYSEVRGWKAKQFFFNTCSSRRGGLVTLQLHAARVQFPHHFWPQLLPKAAQGKSLQMKNHSAVQRCLIPCAPLPLSPHSLPLPAFWVPLTHWPARS